MVGEGHRGAAAKGQIRLRDLQREPLVRPRIRHVSGRRRALFRRQEAAPAGRHARLHPDLSRHEHRRDRHRSAVPRRPRAEFDLQGLRPTIRTTASRPSSTSRTASRRWTSSPRSSGVATRIPAAPEGERQGNAVRPPRDGAYRLRHDPVLLALCEPVHDLRQHLRHRGYALDAQRGRDDRRPVGGNAMGEAPERDAERRPRTASRDRSAARSTARPTRARRPPKDRRSSTIRSPGGGPSSTRRRPAASRPSPKENWDPDQHRLEPHLRLAAADA